MNEAQQYEYRAEELRTIAEEMQDKQARESLLEVASQYKEMAEKRKAS